MDPETDGIMTVRPVLAQHFLEVTNAAGQRQLSGFHPAAMELLVGLPWSGQIDELAQALHGHSQELIVVVQPKTSDVIKNEAGAIDWAKVAKSAGVRIQ